jgi:predicted DNA-binding ribbon-helix-helix protein
MGILNKRSISINGHKTGIFVEGPFWDGLKEIASANKMSLSALVAVIDGERSARNLSSAIRVYVLDYYRSHAESEIPSEFSAPGKT